MTERASLFESSLETDLSDFAPNLPMAPEPKPKPPVEAVRAISQAANFPSREAIPPPPPAPLQASALSVDPRPELPRHRTGRNVQLNLKVRTETVVRFYNIAKREGWVLGETLEHAVEALEEALARKK